MAGDYGSAVFLNIDLTFIRQVLSIGDVCPIERSSQGMFLLLFTSVLIAVGIKDFFFINLIVILYMKKVNPSFSLNVGNNDWDKHMHVHSLSTLKSFLADMRQSLLGATL